MILYKLQKAADFIRDRWYGWEVHVRQDFDLPPNHSLAALYLGLNAPQGTKLRIRVYCRRKGRMISGAYSMAKEDSTIAVMGAEKIPGGEDRMTVEIASQSKSFYFSVFPQLRPHWVGPLRENGQPQSFGWPIDKLVICRRLQEFYKIDGPFVEVDATECPTVPVLVTALSTRFWADLRRALAETDDDRGNWPLYHEDPEEGTASFTKKPALEGENDARQA